jgi:sugar phosphate isomerase/epimerase
MQIALYGSIAWRHPFGFAQVIDWARRCGWDLVDARGSSFDIPGDEAQKLTAFGYDMLGPRQIRLSARRELRRVLEDASLPLLCIYCSAPVNIPGASGEQSRELFREFLQLAADLGAPWVRAINNTTATYQGTEMSAGEAFNATVRGLREVAPHAAHLGIGLMLENNENTTTSDAESLVMMQDALGDVCRTGIAYDPVNAYFQGQDPAAGFEVLRRRITVLHLKNVRRRPPGNFTYVPRGAHSYEWTSLAQGDLDWPALLNLARIGGFDGPLTFEYVNPFKGMPPAYWDTLREPEQAARDEAAYLRRILAEFRPPR